MKPGIRSIIFLAGAALSAAAAAGLYFQAERGGQNIPLTPQELQWLETHGREIRVAPLPDSPPIDFIDKDGNHRGLTADYLRLIGEQLGVRFIQVECDSWKEILEKLESNEIDLVGSVQNTAERRAFLRFTKPYLHIPNVILVRKEMKGDFALDTMGDLRIAIVNGSATHGHLAKAHPEYALVPVKDAASGFRMVSFREVDAMVADLGVASYYIEEMGISNLRVAGDIDYPWNLCLASRKDWPLLNTILDKTLSNISHEQRRGIHRRWITLSDTVIIPRDRSLKIIGILLFATLLAIGSIMFWNRVLKREVAHRTRALDESEERFRNLVETTSDWIWEIDAGGKYTYASPQVGALLGYAPSELIGKSFADLMPPEEAASKKAFFMDVLGKGVPIRSLVNINQHKEGHTVVLETSAVPFYDKGGNIQGYRGIDRDITSRKQAEEMMVQSEKMISVGGLAAGMAHEINNPLAGILQNLQVMRNRVTHDTERNVAAAEEAGTSFEAIQAYMEGRGLVGMMDSIAEAGRRAAKIVDNMLGFSRRNGAHFAPNDLPEIMERSLELASNDYNLKKHFDFRHIRIERDYDSSLGAIPCEGNQIQQVVLNLLSNSAQAMAEHVDDPQITLRLKREGDMALIEIEDNGPGMDAETRKRAFEPFFTTKEVGHGTGLGLSVSYFIITENHGGTMALRSAPGTGTCFSIRIPAERRRA